MYVIVAASQQCIAIVFFYRFLGEHVGSANESAKVQSLSIYDKKETVDKICTQTKN